MGSKLPKATVYTDGGCSPNPGPGGWGTVVFYRGRRRREQKGGEESTTNNRMELQAALEGLRFLQEPHKVKLFTDSQYLLRGVTEWLPRWQANGWQTTGNRDVKNQDLWQALAEQQQRHQVTWRWVKGHAGNRWNERADKLASSAIPVVGLPLADTEAVHVFTAAAWSVRDRRGGWAVLLRFGDHEKTLQGEVTETTANRMHLRAALEGLRALRRRVPVHLYTASDYLKDGATAWLAGWAARGWRTREGRPVSNRDLWEELAASMQRYQVRWHVVPRRKAPEEMVRASNLARAVIRE